MLSLYSGLRSHPLQFAQTTYRHLHDFKADVSEWLLVNTSPFSETIRHYKISSFYSKLYFSYFCFALWGMGNYMLFIFESTWVSVCRTSQKLHGLGSVGTEKF